MIKSNWDDSYCYVGTNFEDNPVCNFEIIPNIGNFALSLISLKSQCINGTNPQ